jgi:hypothetical protein
MYRRFAGVQSPAAMPVPAAPIVAKATAATDGDKAQTANFTMEPEAADGQAAGLEAPEYEYKIRKIDWYFTPKYQFPVGTPVPWGGVNLEGGIIWGKGAFFGLDISFGIDGDRSGMMGAGLSLGNVYDLWNELYLVYGGSVGIWVMDGDVNDRYKTDDMDSYSYDNFTLNFLGPFVKLRWKQFELTYRGLLGIKNERYSYSKDDGGYFNLHYVTVDEGFGLNRHQLMLGYYFATSKRGTPKKVKSSAPSPPDWRNDPIFAPSP